MHHFKAHTKGDITLRGQYLGSDNTERNASATFTFTFTFTFKSALTEHELKAGSLMQRLAMVSGSHANHTGIDTLIGGGSLFRQ
jgi:hypothetical protein